LWIAVVMMVMTVVMTVSAMAVIVAGVVIVIVCVRLAQWVAPGWALVRGDAGSAGSVKVRRSMVGALLLPPRR
jgi:hypothetical protein